MEDLKAEAERLVGLARSKKLTLVTVESCTAGALACALAEAEGAGEVFHGGTRWVGLRARKEAVSPYS